MPRNVSIEIPELVLSVRQPEAQLLVTESRLPGVPVKWIENRSWEPPQSAIGKRIWIHAAGTKPHPNAITRNEKHFPKYTAHGKYERPIVTYSAIIGSVRLVSFTDFYIDPDEEGFDWSVNFMKAFRKCVSHAKQVYQRRTLGRIPRGFDHFNRTPGIYWWMLHAPVLLEQPIPCKGHLGLWNINRVAGLHTALCLNRAGM